VIILTYLVSLLFAIPTSCNIFNIFVSAPECRDIVLEVCWRCRYVRTCVCVRGIICNAHAQVIEAENSITLTIYSSEHVFIALKWRSEMIMGFHEYTYQDSEYIIRAMNTKHARCTCLIIQLVTKPYTYGSSCSRLHV